MKKEVLVSICGLQFMDNLDNSIEVITKGDYYNRNEKHYLLFEERIEGLDGITKNIIKFDDKIVDITKKGAANVHMVFEKNKKNVSCYATPFGNLTVGIMAHRIRIEERDTDIDVEVGYSLDVNDEYLADCSIQLNVKSKDAGDFRLHR